MPVIFPFCFQLFQQAKFFNPSFMLPKEALKTSESHDYLMAFSASPII